MKNQKTIVIAPRAVTHVKNGEAAQPGEATEALNVREREESLEVVGTPLQVASLTAGDRLLAVDGDRFIALRGNDIVLGDAILSTAASEVLGAHTVGDFVVIDTKQERIWLHRTATSYDRLQPQDAVPLLHLGVVSVSTLSATVPEITFSEPLSQWQSPLVTADVATLTSMVADACESMTASIANDGMLAGLVLARYGVRLWDDSYLWLSQPVVVGQETIATNYRGKAQAVTSGSDYVGATSAELQLTAYRLGVSVAQGISSEWESLVKAVDVLVTDAVLPFDPSTADYRLSTSRSSGTREQLLELGPAPLTRQAIAARLLAGKWHVAASTTSIEQLGQGQFASSQAAVSATQVLPDVTAYALQAPSTGDEVEHEVVDNAVQASSHEHLPSCGIVLGGRLYSGGGQTNCLDPWSALSLFCGSITSTPCEVRTITTIATTAGHVQIERQETLPFTPTALNALISSPHESAVSQRIEITSDGSVMVYEAQLALCQTQGMAASIDSSLEPRQLEAGSSTAAITTTSLIPSGNMVTASNVANPLTVGWTQLVTDGEVLALAAAGKPIYNGGFGRYPIYAFTTNGIYALPGSTSTSNDARLLSRKVIDPAVQPADGDGSVWFVTALNQLCSVSGAKVEVALRHTELQSMTWNDAENELCLLMADGTTHLLMSSGRTSQISLAPSQFFGDGVRALAVMPTGAVLDMHQEQICDAAATMQVNWLSQPVELNPRMLQNPAIVEWNIAGSSLDVALAALGERGSSCHGFMVSRIKAQGTLGAPVAVRIVPQPLRTLRLQVSGTMPSGSLLMPVNLELCQPHSKL